MNNPCNLRPSNGKQCAIDFGRKYAEEHGKSPSKEEMINHLHLHEYSKQWADVLRSWCRNAADRVLQTSDHPVALKAKVERLERELAVSESQRIYAERCGMLEHGKDGYDYIESLSFDRNDECFVEHIHAKRMGRTAA